jgi:hypothetical protein
VLVETGLVETGPRPTEPSPRATQPAEARLAPRSLRPHATVAATTVKDKEEAELRRIWLSERGGDLGAVSGLISAFACARALQRLNLGIGGGGWKKKEKKETERKKEEGKKGKKKNRGNELSIF